MKKLFLLGLLVIIFASFHSSAQNSIATSPEIKSMGKLYVDHGVPIKDLLSAGDIEDVCPTDKESKKINRYSGKKEKDTLEFFMFKFNRDIDSKDIPYWIKKKNCRPATVEELLTFYVERKKILCDAIALGIKFRNKFLTLWADSGPGAYLSIDRHYENRWNSNVYFIAVKK